MGKKSRAKKSRATQQPGISAPMQSSARATRTTIAALVIASALSIARFRLEDPLLTAAMLVIASFAAFYIYSIHEVRRGRRAWFAAAIGVVLSLILVGLYRPISDTRSAPEPVVRIEPESIPSLATGAPGSFVLRLTNSGTDIDNVVIDRDYFLAQKRDSRVFLRRVLPSQDFYGPILRANQTAPIRLSFGGLVEEAYRAAAAGFPGFTMVGVRITVRFRRFSDGKDFRIVGAYEVDKALLTLSPPSKTYRRETPGEPPLSLMEILPLLQTDDPWSEASLTFEGTGAPDGKMPMKVAPPK